MAHLFEEIFELAEINIELSQIHAGVYPNEAFILNPRQLRGSDYLMRWSQGQWSEALLISAVATTSSLVAIPYGPSSTAPDKDVRETELYFERLDAANPASRKRPDLLIVTKQSFEEIKDRLNTIGGGPPNYPELPFAAESKLTFLLEKAVLAVECENSLWICKMMPDFNTRPRSMRRLGGKLGLPKGAVLPTVILKDEDRTKLGEWQAEFKIPIHIWHVFYDLGYGTSLDDLENHIALGEVEPSEQHFSNPGGSTKTKVIYKMPHYMAYPLCEVIKAPDLKAAHITDPNGHFLPYVRFEGGNARLLPPAMDVLNTLSSGDG